MHGMGIKNDFSARLRASAVDAAGQAVRLDSIHFVRVYNAVDEVLQQTGELSTEVAGAIDLHIKQ